MHSFFVRLSPALLLLFFFNSNSVYSQNGKELPVLQAMQSELQRSMIELGKLPTPPYYLSYGVHDVRSTYIAASFGDLLTQNVSDRRILDVDLRVGSYEMDNTRAIRGVAFEMGQGTRGVLMPIGNDQRALRTIIWNSTDKAYKSASERLGKVLTNRQVKVREEDTSADLSHEKPHRFIQDPAPFQFDTVAWRERVKLLSGMFKNSPHIYTAEATFHAEYITKYFVNSEGTIIQSSEPIVKLFIICKTKSADGMSLPLYNSYSAYSESRLPTIGKLIADANDMIALSEKLRVAPLMETYSGPAILSGRSAGVFFHEIFGHRAEGHRQKDANSSQTFKAFLGKSILPDFISVVFDPTVSELRGEDIVGAYKFDDEGVPGQKVVAVENGVFKNFLQSRSPIEYFPVSNGHGRRQAGFKCVSRQSNLIVEASKTIPYDSLVASLRRECKKQGKEFGLLFEDIQGGFTFTGRTVPNAFNVLPLVVYKIFADGRPNELVRGVDLIGTPLTTFNNITAAADDMGIFNGVCGAESGGVPVSASSPSLLVSTIEVQKKQKSQAKLPILSNPSIETDGGAK
ncbi:MAG: hypothetical protein HQ472_07355 [Ignavibacteria bacterium]|nr:hypothetical protein [Ignavibacteria bacterium]